MILLFMQKTSSLLFKSNDVNSVHVLVEIHNDRKIWYMNPF